MVVLARPRDDGDGEVTLEEDDVTENLLEKPYVEMLGDTADSAALRKSLSARVRRRERVCELHLPFSCHLLACYELLIPRLLRALQERSPEQFGTMFGTLTSTAGRVLHPPPAELSHRKVLNGTHRHQQGTKLHFLPTLPHPALLPTSLSTSRVLIVFPT